MAKKNNSLLDEIFKSDWKFSAGLSVITFVFAFILLPFGVSDTLARVFLPMLQMLAKLFIFFCVIVSVVKLLRLQINKYKESERLDFDDQPTWSEFKRQEPFKPRQNNSPLNKTHKVESINPNSALKESSKPVEQNQSDIKNRWTLEFINSLDWNIFENLCSRYFSATGVTNKETGLGADDGIDLILYEDNNLNPTGIVQCKKWSNPIGVALLREFLGVMHSKKVLKGYFFTTSKFNQIAIKFADENNIQLIDGALLVSLLKGLDLQKQQEIYDAITQGDYTTPTCVRCGKKMKLRSNKTTNNNFWGCDTYRCRGTLSIKPTAESNKKTKTFLRSKRSWRK